MNFRKGSLIILLIILCCHRTTGHYEFLFLKDMENHPIYKTLKLKSEKQISAIIMLPNGEFNINEAREMIEQIDKLPGSLLTKMEKHRIKLIFFTGDLTSIPSLQSLKGIIPRGYAEASVTWDDVPGAGGSKKVYAKIGSSQYGKGHGSVNLELHELAHSIDKIVFDKIRDSAYFISIWKLEVANLFPTNDYFLHYPEEYFAETFAMYYFSQSTQNILKEKAPKTYRFIKELK